MLYQTPSKMPSIWSRRESKLMTEEISWDDCPWERERDYFIALYPKLVNFSFVVTNAEADETWTGAQGELLRRGRHLLLQGTHPESPAEGLETLPDMATCHQKLVRHDTCRCPQNKNVGLRSQYKQFGYKLIIFRFFYTLEKEFINSIFLHFFFWEILSD